MANLQKKTLTKDEAKRLIILAQGLNQGPKKKSNVVRTLKNIQHLSYIQIDTSMPSSQEMARHLIETSLKYQGLASEKEICYLRNAELKNSVKIELKKMILEGEVIELRVEGLKNAYHTLSSQTGPQTLKDTEGELKILSPFDSFLIQRQRVTDFFDFKYQIECYVPKVKRKYGYFTLPILYKNNLVGVIDTVADRAARKLIVNDTFIVKHLHKEFEFQQKLQMELLSFSKFNGCDTDVTLDRFKVY